MKGKDLNILKNFGTEVFKLGTFQYSFGKDAWLLASIDVDTKVDLVLPGKIIDVLLVLR